MASRPLPLPIWDRQARKRISEFMEDSHSTYESRPWRSLNQLLESHPLYDWMLAAYQNSHRSARKIEPFIRKHNIDMSEFEPVQYRSYADFFERRFRPGSAAFPLITTRWGRSPRPDTWDGRVFGRISSFRSKEPP